MTAASHHALEVQNDTQKQAFTDFILNRLPCPALSATQEHTHLHNHLLMSIFAVIDQAQFRADPPVMETFYFSVFIHY